MMFKYAESPRAVRPLFTLADTAVGTNKRTDARRQRRTYATPSRDGEGAAGTSVRHANNNNVTPWRPACESESTRGEWRQSRLAVADWLRQGSSSIAFARAVFSFSSSSTRSAVRSALRRRSVLFLSTSPSRPPPSLASFSFPTIVTLTPFSNNNHDTTSASKHVLTIRHVIHRPLAEQQSLATNIRRRHNPGQLRHSSTAVSPPTRRRPSPRRLIHQHHQVGGDSRTSFLPDSPVARTVLVRLR